MRRQGDNVQIEPIYVLHEYGARSHYSALVQSASREVVFYEFALGKLILKSFYYCDLRMFFKQFSNLLFILRLAFSQGKTIVFGMAPFDVRIMLFKMILRNHFVTYHSSWPDWSEHVPKVTIFPFVRSAWKEFLLRCNRIACVTPAVASSIRSFVETKEIPLAVVYHALTPVFLTQTAQELQCTRGNGRCLFVGRLEPSKGIGLILDLAKENQMIEFVIVGENRGRYCFDGYKNITYKGVIKDPEVLKLEYCSSDFILLPSIYSKRWQELFGLVVIEAMSTGCIPICTDNVGPKSILNEEFSYLLFSEDSFVEEAGRFLVNLLGEIEKKELIAKMLCAEAKKYYPDEIYKKWNL